MFRVMCLSLGRKQLALGRRLLTSVDMVHRLAHKVVGKLNHELNLPVVHHVRTMAPVYFVFLLCLLFGTVTCSYNQP